MAQQIELAPEYAPHQVGSGGLHSAMTHAMKTPNGDVEITRTIGGDERRVLTVIPRDKRAELAAFLVEND